MKDRKNLEAALRSYLSETLGAAITLRPWDAAGDLPLFLRDRYQFFTARLFSHPLLLLLDEAGGEQTPVQIRTHMERAQIAWDNAIVYVCRQIEAYRRKRLIQQRLPFIVPGNQMYLPALGIDLREYFRAESKTPPKFRPATQAILLYAIQNHGGDALTASKMAEALGYSVMTFSRAFDEFEAAALGDSEMRGRERHFVFSASPRETWAQSQALLATPVNERHWVQRPPQGFGLIAGESALARLTDLAPPRHEVRATSKGQWRQAALGPQVIPAAEPGACEIELWRYDPARLAKQSIADPLSVYLSLKESSDERVEAALAAMLEQMQW